MIRRLRIRWASKFGRIEHTFGRIMVLPILMVLLYGIYIDDDITMGLGIMTGVFWLIYLSSHTMEKKLYGRHGSRG